MSLVRFVYHALSGFNRATSMLRPRRILHPLGRRAYEGAVLAHEETRWYRDRRGHRFLLNPYYFLDRQIVSFGDYEPALHRFINRCVEPGSTCLDLGANAGFFSVHLGQRVGPRGQVFCFEPLPAIFRRLSENIAANDMGQWVHPVELAVSNANGTAQINFGTELLQNQGLGSLVNKNELLSESIEVRTVKLDDFVQERGIEHVHFCKIDLQGSEPLFFEGAAEVMKKMRPLLCFEVGADELKGLGLTPADLVEQVEGLGYEVYALKSDGRRGARLVGRDVAPDFRASSVCGWPK